MYKRKSGYYNSFDEKGKTIKASWWGPALMPQGEIDNSVAGMGALHILFDDNSIIIYKPSAEVGVLNDLVYYWPPERISDSAYHRMGSFMRDVYEPEENEEKRRQREAIKHLTQAADALGYKLEKKS